jgi:2-polyprenyl-3-methyl-5-hydroxy-6-metoxy-1,4-benzoquinol methylase
VSRFDRIPPALFDRYADIIDGRYRPWLESVLPEHAVRALDAGCGAGRYTTLLADRCQQVLGIDVAEGLLTRARQRRARPNITYTHRDLRDLAGGEDGRFDVVLAVAVVHHLPDPAAAIRQLAGLVAPGGRLLIVDMVRPYQQWTRPRVYYQALVETAHELVGRRSLRDAAVVLRLRLHPEWIAHITTSNAAPHEQVLARYASTLPAADVTDLYASVGVCWRAPTQPRPPDQPTNRARHHEGRTAP